MARVLATSGLARHHLTLEITESVLVQDVEATVAAFAALKALGVRLAIDDFGTGYSSLSYLRQFPIDILKIDRSFVAGLDGTEDASALVRSILGLSATLRLETVAEGIETSEQREALHSLGADRGQGYLFARPLPVEAMAELLCTRAIDRHASPARRGGGPSKSTAGHPAADHMTLTERSTRVQPMTHAARRPARLLTGGVALAAPARHRRRRDLPRARQPLLPRELSRSQRSTIRP